MPTHSATTQYEHVEIERHGAIATLWLNRPARLNALHSPLMRELTHAANAFHDDTETRVVVVAGRGRHFCAGADLKATPHEGPADPAPADRAPTLLRRARDARAGSRLMAALLDIPQITIAAVHGAALGGGCCIATACDIRLGASDAFCGYPEVDRGMNLQWRALPLCTRLIGPARAKRMLILGRNEPASLLLEWGFFEALAPASELLAAAHALAEEYAAKPPIAAQMIKRSVDAVTNPFGDAIMHMDHEQWLLTSLTADYREGIAAFRERRKARFEGD